VYFVHSFGVPAADVSRDIVGSLTRHGENVFVSSVATGNVTFRGIYIF
jgi:imidazoleglycerol phosphate synthase glutamine amidotransferase subunit HisH